MMDEITTWNSNLHKLLGATSHKEPLSEVEGSIIKSTR